MRRIRLVRGPLARLLSVAWLATWALLGLGVNAHGQAPGPESFAKVPKDPLELWDAVDYLVRVGQAEKALTYLNAFLKSKPDDSVLLQIRDRYGVGSVLRLGDYPATQAQARPLMEMVSAAAHRNATNPERLNRFVAALTKTREEQQHALERLREAGPYAVPLLVETLKRPNLPPADRAQIVASMGRLDRTAVPALLSVLDSPDTSLAASAAEALGQIGDPMALPYLTFLCAKNVPQGPVGAAARRAVVRITGRPFESQPQSAVRLLTDEARKYQLHAVNFPDEQVELWVWDGGPTPRRVSQSDAEGILGLRFARQALELDPADLGAQIIFLSLVLESAVKRVGLDAFPENDPTGAYPSALAAGPRVLSEVLRTALAVGHTDLAVVAASALGQVTDRGALSSTGRPHPLVEALSAPDRRVQLAAARALVQLEPLKPFPGSSRVVPVLARFVTNHAAAKVVVIDSNTTRGSQVVGFLRSFGYQPQLAPTGDQGFRLAAGSADVEAILLEPSLADGAWRLIDTLANLRADTNTVGIPILLMSPLSLHDRLRIYTKSFTRVGLLVTPANAQILKEQLDRELARMGFQALSAAEHDRSAQEAALLLSQVAGRAGNPFEPDLAGAAAALTAALNKPTTALTASAALGDVPGIDAQRGLADVLLDPGKPGPLRLNAASRLIRSIQRFGPLVSAFQEQRLTEMLDQASDASLNSALAAVVGALRPKPASIGRRLQSYKSLEAAPDRPTSIAPPSESAPAAPRPEAEPRAAAEPAVPNQSANS